MGDRGEGRGAEGGTSVPAPPPSGGEGLPPPPGWGGTGERPDAVGMTTTPDATPGFDLEHARKAVWELGRVEPGQDGIRRDFLLLLENWFDDEAHKRLVYDAQKSGQLEYVAKLYRIVQALDPVDLRAQQALRQIAASSMFSAGVATGTQRERKRPVSGLLWLAGGLSTGGLIFIANPAARIALGLVLGAVLTTVVWKYLRNR